MLLDEFFPAFDVSERHVVHVDATPQAVYAALRTADLSGHPVARMLLALRAVPALLRRGTRPAARSKARRRGMTLADFEQHGFVVLADDAATRRRFRWYWRVIRPGSGLIRRAMLASIRRAAEAA
jgi:hypothetical protein